MVKDLIKKLREDTGLSQRKFAKEIKLSQSMISDYECGDKLPSYNALVILNDYAIKRGLIINFLENYDEQVKSVEEKVC
jgi:transcriptional regulator with XRE-family HTH domain